MYAKLPFELSGSMPDNLYLGLVDDAPFGALPAESIAFSITLISMSKQFKIQRISLLQLWRHLLRLFFYLQWVGALGEPIRLIIL